jgi:hypothetical protein
MADQKSHRPTPILSIDTLMPIATILIDGKPYELKSADMLPLFDYKRLERYRERIADLMAQDDITTDQTVELDELLDRQAKLLLDAPAKVHARLKPAHRMQVYLSFLELPMAYRPVAAAKTPAPAPDETSSTSIGATTSAASSISTQQPIPAAG